MTRHAVALRAFTHANDAFEAGALIPDMDDGQFEDWAGAELVREATDDEVAEAQGQPPSD